MAAVGIRDLKEHASDIVDRAEAGEAFLVTRRGKPVADLVRTTKPTGKKPELGFLKGKKIVLDPDWWKPMTDEEVDAFLEGRY